jgi:predicted transglutaminase-like cysteine proteinase
MRSLAKIIAVLTALVTFGSASAPAAVFSFSHLAKTHIDRVAFAMPVMGPFAYTHFCLRYADDCRVRGYSIRGPRRVKLTDARWQDLVAVNRTVNGAIAPKHYVNDVSYDTWRVAPTAGDCNDYAVTKRHELLAKGWPSRALLLSEVVTSWGEHHLVLLVRTERQDFVLDNLNANIKVWSKAPYRWVRTQSPTEPALWSTIAEAHPARLS